jgi:hypothetical protein
VLICVRRVTKHLCKIQDQRGAMQNSVVDSGPRGVRSSNGRLDSWKEIANYVGRGLRTVPRWEFEEALPVHRHIQERQEADLHGQAPALTIVLAQPFGADLFAKDAVLFLKILDDLLLLLVHPTDDGKRSRQKGSKTRRSNGGCHSELPQSRTNLQFCGLSDVLLFQKVRIFGPYNASCQEL